MSESTQSVVSDGALTELALTLQYFTRAEISVAFDGTVTTAGWSWPGPTGSTIQFSPAVPNGVTVQVRRTTAITTMRNIFSSGALFLQTVLDENFSQLRRAIVELQATVASISLENLSASVISYTQTGIGAIARFILDKLRERVSVKDFGATGDGVTDDTAAIQAALDAHLRVHFPHGVYRINANTGLKYRTGALLEGDSRNRSVLAGIEGTGGTVAQILGYVKGSLLSRRVNASVAVTGATWTIPTFTINGTTAQKFRVFNNTATDHSAKTVTINGTNLAGAAQSEVLALPAGSGQAFSVLSYRTVTSLVPSATIGADTMQVVLTNEYVNDVVIRDLAIVCNHPAASITATAIQIGLDLRNSSGVTVRDCHVGNIPPVGGPFDKAYSKPYVVQGYGVVFGNTSTSDPMYCGGEKNRLLNTNVYGAYKTVVQDDPALSGASAAYGCIVRDCDIQTGHWLIAQMSQYGAGSVHHDNILQDIQKQVGDVSPSYVQYYNGYNNRIRPAYVESGSNVDFQLLLDSQSNNNVVDMAMASASSGAGAISDLGTDNEVSHYDTNGVGQRVKLYNKSNTSAWIKCHYDGVSLMVIDGARGVTAVPSRTGAGDYTITWQTPFPTAHYSLSVALDTNASAHGGTWTIRSHAANNVRVNVYAQNGGTSTPIDPRYIWIRAEQ